ncbi:hypothetical protein [Nonomuraea typhae]|uniref:DUF4386 domain-containing protein n=1 Tax=Nonomuraea typhae TaxID=2603600 RepID=A0ABW7YQ54_9ACTN
MRWTLIFAVLAANIAFIGLGITFDYPGILTEPPAEILAAFAATQAGTTAWFLLLAAGAAALIPAAVLLARRLPDGSAATLSAHVGVLAGAVQVAGLMRWPYAVPKLVEAPDAATLFTTLHSYLGVGIGETLGYLLTAAWTALVLSALPRAPRWFTLLGAASAVAIASGVLGPLGVPGVDTANFIGYLAWSAWTICLAVLAGRLPARVDH